jgi:hypothetical protein
MRINMTNILKAGEKSIAAVNKGLEFIEDSANDLVSKIVAWDQVAKAGREHLLWALAAKVEATLDVTDWAFRNSLKVYFDDFQSPEGKAFAKLDKGQQLKIAKAWSEVVAGVKAGKGTASQQRNKRKQAKAGVEAPKTYRQVLNEAKALTHDEQESLFMALAKNLGISTRNLKSA